MTQFHHRGEMSKNNTSYQVPAALRTWFMVHFIVDLIFALPLMIVPAPILTLVGWQVVDPFTARLAAAALFGIGIESFLGRDANRETYSNMLRLKIIWSSAAVLGIAASMAQGSQGTPSFAWLVLALFAGFNLLWVYWFLRLKKS